MFQQAWGNKKGGVSILAIARIACIWIRGLVKVYISVGGKWWQNWRKGRLGDVGDIWVD